MIVALLLGFVLHRTRFGHYVYAVGGNPVASARMGLKVARVRFAVYVLASACAAVSGIILIGQTASATPQAALGYELTAIAAVIVGGAPLGGGRGRMTGTIVGVFSARRRRKRPQSVRRLPFLATGRDRSHPHRRRRVRRLFEAGRLRGRVTSESFCPVVLPRPEMCLHGAAPSG